MSNLADDIKINKYALPDECERHASMYFYWSDLLAEAKAAADHADDFLKLTLAEQQAEVRKDFEERGIKITEAQVTAGLEINTKVRDARLAVRLADKEKYLLEAAVSALEHRRGQLDNLTKLAINQWYATPNSSSTGVIPTETSEVENDLRKNLKRKGV